MARQIRAQVNLNSNEILNMAVENVSSLPTTMTRGRIVYYNGSLYVCNGTEYVQVIASDTGLDGYQLISEKDQANGYAGLDANTKILVAQIPTGVAVDTVPLLKATIADGQSIIYSSSSGGFVAFDVSTVYHFVSTCTSAQLDEVNNQQAGDVYSLTDERQFEGGTYAAGTNWVWDASDSQWEPLTGILDLTGYQTVDNMVTSLAGATASQYPSANAVSTAIAAVEAIATAAQTAVAAAVVANPAITAGTHTKITYDAKGLVTAGSDLLASDIPDISATYQVVSQKNQANGYVGLDENSKVDISYLPTGVGADLIPVPSTAGTAGQALVVNTEGNGYTFASIPTTTTLLRCYETTITGNGSTATYTLSHGFSTPCAVTILDASNEVVYTDVTLTATSSTVTFSPAPSASETFTVRVIGY